MRRLAALFLIAFLFGCGGHGGAPTSPVDTETLCWKQPELFADNTPLNPARDIAWYEIHVSDNAAWGDNTLRAALSGVDNAGLIVRSFNLALLAEYGIHPGDNGCYVTVRSIGPGNTPSEYGKPCWWEGRP